MEPRITMDGVDGAKPWRRGLRCHGLTESRALVPKYELQCAARTLQELCGDYVFFTPAVLYLHGGFTDHILNDLFRQHPDVRFYYRKFERQLFSGLALPDGDADWNFAIWAVEVEAWAAVRDFLTSIVLFRPSGSAMQIAEQRVQIVDPLGVRRVIAASELPLIGISSFCLLGSEGGLGLFADADLTTRLVRPPRLCRFLPDGQMQEFADALKQDRLELDI